MVSKCCVKNCPSRNSKIQLHAFPKDPELFEVWLKKIKRNVDYSKRKSVRICDKHFSEDMKFAEHRNRTKLKAGAVPDLYLPENIESEVLNNGFTKTANAKPEICRICMKNQCEFLDIFAENESIFIPTMFLECGSITVAEDDGLPSQICKDCFHKLTDAYILRQQIIASDKHLHDNLEKEQQTAKNYIMCEDLTEEQQETEVKKDSEIKPNDTEDVDCLELTKMNKQKILCCKECNKTFKNQYYYEVHRTIHTGYRPFTCDVCSKGFSMRWVLNMHLRIHTGIKPYSCKICGKKFRFSSSLPNHMRTHTGVRPYQCNICDKTFTQIGGLKAHERTHTGEKPFICEVCGKGFTGFAGLNRHMVTHTNERNHPCPTCGKCFADRAHVYRHLKTHSGEKPFTCELCGKKFTARGSLIVHKNIHEGVKPHSCKICGKCFTQANCVVRHMRIHSGETPYACTLCDKRFSYSHHLGKHMKVHQPVV